MKPGDLIEWVYKHNMSTVNSDEILWSSTMKDYVPIGGINLLVLADENKITWMNDKGLFHARVDDTCAWNSPLPATRVVPRMRR